MIKEGVKSIELMLHFNFNKETILACTTVPWTTPGTKISQPEDPTTIRTALKRRVQIFETWKITLFIGRALEFEPN